MTGEQAEPANAYLGRERVARRWMEIIMLSLELYLAGRLASQLVSWCAYSAGEPFASGWPRDYIISGQRVAQERLNKRRPTVGSLLVRRGQVDNLAAPGADAALVTMVGVASSARATTRARRGAPRRVSLGAALALALALARGGRAPT